MTVRHDAAAAIGAIPFFAKWQIYAIPPEVVEPPGVVIQPGDPYQEQDTFALGSGRIVWRFDLLIVAPRGSPDDSLTRIENAAAALRGLEGPRFVDLTNFEQIEVADVSYLGATLTLEVPVRDT